MVLEPIKMKEEKELFFTTPTETKELGCIGHLRGDFGKDGREFHTTWHEHKCHEKNDENFQTIFDAIINKLREKGNVLFNHGDMYSYCRGQDANRVNDSVYDCPCWGFRILTQDYAIYLRCEPQDYGYHFYAYCYDKKILMTKLAKDRGLPRYCYSYLPTTQEEIRIDIAESGYTPIRKQGNGRAAKEMNRELGITPAQAKAMQVGSMFGWNVPGADPKSYDADGKAIKKKSSREER